MCFILIVKVVVVMFLFLLLLQLFFDVNQVLWRWHLKRDGHKVRVLSVDLQVQWSNKKTPLWKPNGRRHRASNRSAGLGSSADPACPSAMEKALKEEEQEDRGKTWFFF